MIDAFNRRRFLKASAAAVGVSALRAASPAPDSRSRFRGFFPILQTAFDPSDQIDEAGMVNQVNFVLRAGAHGIVWPQIISEFYTLAEEERTRLAELILKTSGGRVPVVIGVQATNKLAALRLARHAAEHGAAAVIALPPYTGKVTMEGVTDYYHALAEAVKLPVFVQNTGNGWGPALPMSYLIQLARENPRLAHVKEETSPIVPHMAELAKAGIAVFSGTGGVHLLNELDHGSAGTMGPTYVTDIVTQIYNLYTSDKMDAARSLYQKYLPIHRMESLHGLTGFAKAMLVRRGLIQSAKQRNQDIGSEALDGVDERELALWWKQLEPYLKA